MTINKQLHKDMQLIGDQYGVYDIQFNTNTDDLEIVEDLESLKNAIIITVLTRFNEIPVWLYDDYGCRVHELIKANMTSLTVHKIKSYITQSLNKMHRVKTVDDIQIKSHDKKYYIELYVTSINNTSTGIRMVL